MVLLHIMENMNSSVVFLFIYALYELLTIIISII